MNEHLQQMIDVATGVMTGVFITAGKPDVYFKRSIELQPGRTHDLLVVGTVHRDCDDGYCVAVLNPDDELTSHLTPGVGYSEPILKEMVSGHCKAMVFLQCRGRATHLVGSYLSRRK